MTEFEESVVWLFNNHPIEFQLDDNQYYSNAYSKGTVTKEDIEHYVKWSKEYHTTKGERQRRTS